MQSKSAQPEEHNKILGSHENVMLYGVAGIYNV